MGFNALARTWGWGKNKSLKEPLSEFLFQSTSSSASRAIPGQLAPAFWEESRSHQLLKLRNRFPFCFTLLQANTAAVLLLLSLPNPPWTGTHTGTHLDAVSHFREPKWSQSKPVTTKITLSWKRRQDCAGKRTGLEQGWDEFCCWTAPQGRS